MTASNDQNLKDCGDFIFLRPPAAIVGVEPPSDRCSSDNRYKGVFISGRTVKLSDYYIGKYQVTYKLWKEVYDWNRNNNKGYSFRSGRKGSHGDSRNTENDPVTEVSWYDCIVWCNAYTEKEKGIEHCVYRTGANGSVLKSASNPSQVYYDQSKKGYRLPTEAEWEYAARFHGKDSTNSTKYGKYDYLLNTDQFSGGCWYRDNSDYKTHPVGQKAANYAGIRDMSGNVWEWCYDGWENPLPTGVQTNTVGSASADSRVIRGGSWYGNANDCVVGYRSYWWFYYRNGNVGFRVACSQ